MNVLVMIYDGGSLIYPRGMACRSSMTRSGPQILTSHYGQIQVTGVTAFFITTHGYMNISQTIWYHIL